MIYLQINLKVSAADRPAATAIYNQYRKPFLDRVHGALSKVLLVREEDVQVLHSFESNKQAEDYLASKLFTTEIVTALKPLLQCAPDIRIYSAADPGAVKGAWTCT